MPTCAHNSIVDVKDMPIADTQTFTLVGRFDVEWCLDCLTVVNREPANG
jgi:hypothetical protein